MSLLKWQFRSFQLGDGIGIRSVETVVESAKGTSGAQKGQASGLVSRQIRYVMASCNGIFFFIEWGRIPFHSILLDCWVFRGPRVFGTNFSYLALAGHCHY